MIALRANTELRQTFEKLIETMKVPVKWNGVFVVINNYIILQGEVRSLFFHFDNRKVVTNIIDLEIKESDILECGENRWIRNVINMILYAFGKWGTIPGLKVEKNYGQLNQLFSGILKEIQLEGKYNQDQFYFYKDSVRITYEDVIQVALETKEEEQEAETEEEQGLWHKLRWEKEEVRFGVKEIPIAERSVGRLGCNFYPISYLCPNCGDKMHMVVYPEGKEFRIETTEGDVLIVRAATCPKCMCFYTPRPRKLLAEGDIYYMDFEGDKTAYEDYLDLLGREGDKVSNYQFNRYANEKRLTVAEHSERLKKEEVYSYLSTGTLQEDLERWLKSLSLPEFQELVAKIEEGYFPDAQIEKIEKTVQKEKKARKRIGKTWDYSIPDRMNAEEKSEKNKQKDNAKQEEQKEHAKQKKEVLWESAEQRNKTDAIENVERKESTNVSSDEKESSKLQEYISDEEENEEIQKFTMRIGHFPRLSERQRNDLRTQIERSPHLRNDAKESLLERFREEGQKEQLEKIRSKTSNLSGKTYVVLERMEEEIEQADLPQEEKQSLLNRLRTAKKEAAESEVEQLLSRKPAKLDRKGYQSYLEKIRSYKEVDTSAYEEALEAGKEEAEEAELKGMIQRSRVITREDLSELLDRIFAQDFSPHIAEKYVERIKDKIRVLDREAIDEIIGDPTELDFEGAEVAYEAIKAGNFLPELKTDALKALEKRLKKIKTDECELLVQKLAKELASAGIPENVNHYFYPARKVLQKQATKEETEVIDYALASYAAGIGPFEYPILVVDTAKKNHGEKGFILTPEKLFYSNMTTSFCISVFGIDKITASTGVLNRGLYVHHGNGNKTKIPYAVENGQLTAFASVLDEFVTYLQEKPFSRKETYLAKEKHETICCFRCGNVYKGGNICPKCGYQMNE